MKHSSPSRVHGARVRRPLWCRPAIELLERRLPPGDILWTMLLGGSGLTLDMDANEIQRAGASLRFEKEPELSRELSRPTPPAMVASQYAETEEPVRHREDSTLDDVNRRMGPARLFSGPNLTAMNRTHGASLPGLAVPGHRTAPSTVAAGSVLFNAPHIINNFAASETPNSVPASEASSSEILDNYGKLPLSFEQNVGQFDDRVDFVSRAGGSTVFLTPTAAVFAMQKSESRIQNSESSADMASVDALARRDLPSHVGLTPRRSQGVALYIQIVGGNPDARPMARDQAPGITNYFIGNDANEWHTNIASFGRVEYDDVYPGIDLAYYGNNNQLEYDFIVSPGADPNAIALNFAGADGVEINPQGDLVVHTAAGDVVQQKPFTYQEIGDSRREVASGYVAEGDAVRFDIGSYDPSLPIVIDPLVVGLAYSTFLGGSGQDEGYAIAVDSNSGNAYVTGYTLSTDFPTTPGAFDTTHNGSFDAFVTKLNAAGSALVYSTFLGGSSSEIAEAIALDGSGNAYITGYTQSSNFPTTPGAFDTTHNGSPDAFVTKLNASGSALVYSTFLGGLSVEYGYGIAIDDSGNTYVTGYTEGTDFPTTPGAFDTTLDGLYDSYITKLNATGSALAYSTFLGGSNGDLGNAIAVNANGDAYVTGGTGSSNFQTTPGAFDTSYDGSSEAFVTKLNATGSALIYSTFLGGSGVDKCYGLALDGSGNAYVAGYTIASNFPTTPGAFDTTPNGAQDAFVTKLNTTGSALVYSTFLGGADADEGWGLALDASGNAYVSGYTNSSNFPTTPGIDAAGGGAFVTKLNAGGSALIYSANLGSALARTVALDASGNAYVTGNVYSFGFPTTPGAFDTTENGNWEPFVTKLRTVVKGPLGNFVPHNITTAADSAADVFAADVDSDGDMDVLSAGDNANLVAWYENNGSQDFTPHTIATGLNGARTVFAADIDSDYFPDVLSASFHDDKIVWYRNNGFEVFTAQTISTAANGPQDVLATDLDGDGDTDVLSASYLDDKIAWYRNNGSEVFTALTISTAANGANSVVAADVDGDGDTDVLSASIVDNKIAWYKNDGNENFTAHTISTAAISAKSVFAADVDSDGDTDVLSASYSDDKIAWYKNDGNENFTSQTITSSADWAKSVFAADMDADGDTDVLSASVFDNKIALYKNDGNENFSTHIISNNAMAANSVFAADVDSDGDADVLSASSADDKIAWYENLYLFDVSNTNDSGLGSLRQAILDANANPGVDTITFSLGYGVQTIAPTTALPTITDPVIIDGTTEIDYAGTPLVVLSGANIPTQLGLHITGGSSTIKGLVINGFTSGVAIRLETSGGNVVTGNYIGTNAAGAAAVPNLIGVIIGFGSASNSIGGTTTSNRNLISGNGTGIIAAGNSNVIQGNFIGTNAAGTAALGNTSDAVHISGASNLIGGTAPGAGNRIAFNVGDGIVVDTGVNNAIRQNTIYSNGGLGIDLIIGGNNNQAKPSVNAATSGGGTTTITATLVSAPTTTYTLEFFSSPTCDPSTFGEGETYLGSKTLTTKSTGRGRTIFVAGVEVPVGHVITATATSPGNDTSEFSKCQTVT